MANLGSFSENSNDSLDFSAEANENGILKVFSNDEFGSLDTVLINGIPYFGGKSLASMLGYTNPQKAIRDHVDEEDRIYVCISDSGRVNESFTPNGNQRVMINEYGFYSLVLRSNKEEAKRVRRWVTSEVLPSIMRVGSYSLRNKPIIKTSIEEKLCWIGGVSNLMGLSKLSTLMLLKKASEGTDLPLPDYVPSEGILKSATVLLKENGLDMSAKAFNKILVNKGVLEEKERPSSKRGVARFKAISKDWLEFGENQVSPNNPRETQPLWYEDKFLDLLRKLELV